MLTSLLIGSFVLVALAGLLLGYELPARRSRRLEHEATKLGFRFSERATPFENTDVQGLTILPDGASTVVTNLLERTNGACRFLIGDIREEWHESSPIATTVAAFSVRSVHIPVFQIEERGAVRKVAEQVEHALGKNLHHFDTGGEFGHNFFVSCSNKDEVKSFLTQEKLAYLRDHAHHYQVESSPDWLLIYRHDYELKAENLKEFSEDTRAMASVLLSLQSSNPTAA